MIRSQSVQSNHAEIKELELTAPQNVTCSATQVVQMDGENEVIGVEVRGSWDAVPNANEYEVDLTRDSNEVQAARLEKFTVSENSFVKFFPGFDVNLGPLSFKVTAIRN